MEHVAIVVTVYNEDKFIKRCIDSLLCQTYKNYELVIVDDGSVDQSSDICDEYAYLYNFIHVIHKKNEGVSSARNVALDYLLSQRSCKWITFVDSDDWVHPDYLKALVDANIINSTRISVCDYKTVNEYEKSCENHTLYSYVENIDKVYFTKDGWVNSFACFKLIDLALLRDVRFPEGKNWEDLAAGYKFMFKVDCVSVIDCKLYYYYKNPYGIVSSEWTEKRLDELDAYDAILPFFQQYKNGELYYKVLKSYAMACAAQIDLINRSPNVSNRSDNLLFIRKKLRRLLLRCLVNNPLSFSRNIRCFEAAFPTVLASCKIIRHITNNG